jgi:hypothetical protein
MPVRRKITALAVGTLALSGGIPAGASAAEPGFTVDPQSPAGVEYQIPLDNARGQGGGSHHHGGSLGGGGGTASGGGSNGGGGTSGGSGGSGSGTSSPNLFGVGITPATGHGSNAGGRGNGGTGNGGPGRSGSGGSGGGSRHLPSLTTTADYSTTGPIAGIVVAILITGAAFGLFLRLRARGPKKIFS